MKTAVAKLIHALRTTFPAIVPAEGFAEFNIKQSNLDNFNDSKAKLLDPTILIDREAEAELFTKHGYMETEKSHYPTNAVKALWNIAVRVNRVVDNGILIEAPSYKSHQLFIETNYNYLDFMGEGKPNSYLLKVVDDTTLKLAKVYLIFLDDIIKNPRALDFIPIIPAYVLGVASLLNPAIEFAKKNCHGICQKLYDTLSDTVKRYEARKQGQSTLSKDNPTDKMAKKNISAMAYFDKLLPEDSSVDYHKIHLTDLLSQVQDINYENCVTAIESEILKQKSDTTSTSEYMYAPRFSQNPAMEVTYLTTNDYNDGMIFMPVDQKKEAMRTAQRNLRNMTSSANQYAMIEKMLPGFLAHFLAVKIAFYEKIISLAEALQKADPAQSNDEIINTIFNKLIFLEDLTAIENFLAVSIENNAKLVQIILRSLAEPFEKMKAIREKTINAQLMIKNYLKEIIGKDIAHIINNDAPTEIKLINSENNDSNELFVIATITQLKRRKENIELQIKSLQTKYHGSPDEFFKKLQDHLFSLENEINLKLELLLQIIHHKYVAKPLPFNKIETTDQKTDVIKYIGLWEASDKNILNIANFINAEFSNYQELKLKVQQAMDSNLTQLENANKMLKAFGNIYHLNQQRQELLVKQQVLAQEKQELKQQLEIEQKRLTELAQQAEIHIKIDELNIHIDKACAELRNLQERKPTLDNQEIERSVQTLAVLENDFTQRQSISGMFGAFFKSMLPTNKPENMAQEFNSIEKQIADLKSRLENLQRPMKIFQGTCETIQKQIRELESEKMILSTSVIALSPETAIAFQNYQICNSKINSFREQISRNTNENTKSEAILTQLRNDIVSQTTLFNQVLAEYKVKLTIILKQLGIPRISNIEIDKMRSNFIELLSTIDIENCAKIIESVKINQDTRLEYDPLVDLHTDINKNIAAIKDCFTSHDLLSKYTYIKQEIYEKYFLKNPEIAKLIKPVAQSNINTLAKSLQTMMRSMSASPPPPPVMTRANYLTQLDNLYCEYLRTGASEKLRTELYNGCQNLPFNDLPNGDEVKASFKKFMSSLLEDIATIEYEIQKIRASLANISGSNLSDSDYCYGTPLPADYNTGLRLP